MGLSQHEFGSWCTWHELKARNHCVQTGQQGTVGGEPLALKAGSANRPDYLLVSAHAAVAVHPMQASPCEEWHRRGLLCAAHTDQLVLVLQ
jgi:hypothetical protein